LIVSNINVLGVSVMMHKILIVDDDPSINELLKDALSSEPYYVFSAESAEEAMTTLDRELVDIVISDEKMPGMSGTEFLSIVRQKYPDTIRMILTGHASVDLAIRAINEVEIHHFFTKPCNVIEMAVTIRQILKERDLEKENRRQLEKGGHQSSSLEALEEQYPGITEVKRDATGAIIIDDI